MKRTLAEWLDLQQASHPRSIDLGLARVTEVARRLEVDRPPFRVVTVAGTNGKGSTVAYLESILRSAGIAVGAFTSPHLVRYNERIRIRGVLVEDEALVEAFERIEAARHEVTLTFFEYNTLAALLLFRDAGITVGVLEVGLGGRLDATNLVDADVAVLTSIGFDHHDWLGSTLDSIGAEKAGIVRGGRPAVLATPEMPASVYERIDACGARAVIAGRDYVFRREGAGWSYRGGRVALSGLPLPPLTGAPQLANAASAIAALEWLDARIPLDATSVARGLAAVELPGRFQVVAREPEWILDVAHNEPAARVLASELAARPAGGRTFGIVGILRDKEVAAMGAALAPAIDRWILCSLPGPRGLEAHELASLLTAYAPDAALAPSVVAACERAQAEAQPCDRIVVCGSFLTVGPALEWLRLY